MSANVDSMFSVREVPWHREGIVLGDYPGSWAEARKPAGLEWEAVEQPVYRFMGLQTKNVPVYELHGMDDSGEALYKLVGAEAQVVEKFEKNDGHKHIVHSGTNAILAVGSKNYTLIDHDSMGEILETVLGEANIKYETAGSLGGGRKVWALVKLDEPVVLPGDSTETYMYMMLANSHDGTGACTLRPTTVRVVCQNTWSMSEAEGERHGAAFSFRHSKKWRDRIDEVREAITGVRKDLVAYRVLMEELLGIPITAGQRELFTREFFPTPPVGLATDRVLGNVEASRTMFRTLFDSPTTQNVAHTAYGLVQAASEYLDHIRVARTWETRINRMLMKPEPLKAKAVKLAREVAKIS